MKAATLLLVSVVILTSVVGCKKTSSKDAVWNRDNLGAIVELEPTLLDLTPTPQTSAHKQANEMKIPEIEEEEDYWCNA